MLCWNSTHNVAQVSKAKILSAALNLTRALQEVLKGGQVALSSRDKDEKKQGIEIVVWFKSGTQSEFVDVT
jgi:hypothetical protein